MEFPESDVGLAGSDSLSLGLMLDIKTEKSLMETSDNDGGGGCMQHASGDLCKELSPSSSECPFANLPLFGECGLELSQDCSSPCLSDSADAAPPKACVKSSSDGEESQPPPPPRKRKRKTVKQVLGKEGGEHLPHKCPICGKGFLYSSNLTSHVKRHGDKSFQCEECDKTFALSVNYEAHMRFHSGIKPYSCEVCGKSFSWSGGYHRHQRIHSGFKPYICTDCGKEFSDIGNYNNHRRVHTGERPHVCSECGKGFSRSDSLNRHMITHSHVKMFACTQCGHEFKHLESLNKHCRRIHEVLKPLKRDECLKQSHRILKVPKRSGASIKQEAQGFEDDVI
ncbi:uncharacterized protein LOC143274849 [Babylonia areolata]|uniref:uncharacterized protein LOC143274849 n=1 Tax=Babylonia areolata TaxID=304850 RepID=UPI003FD0EA52